MNGMEKQQINAENATEAASGTKTLKPEGLFRRLLREKGGAAAIEFAVLALPFLIMVFASLETFAAFFGEQILASANDTMARKLRTGEITFNLGRATDKTEEQFRQMYCDQISYFLSCSATEAKTPGKLYIDVRSYTEFSKIPTAIPRNGNDFDTKTTFAPGGPQKINMVRAYYRWSVVTDLVRPYVTNLRPAGSSMPKDYLMVATNTFINESF